MRIFISFSESLVVARITNGTDHYQNTSVSLAGFFISPPKLGTQLYYPTTIKSLLSANEFKTESNLSSYMSKAARLIPV